jgi:hypothetical protein
METNTTNTTKRLFTVVMSEKKANCYEVHAVRCCHATKISPTKIFAKYRSASAETLKANMLADFEEQGWTADMIRIMTCSKNAPTA